MNFIFSRQKQYFTNERVGTHSSSAMLIRPKQQFKAVGFWVRLVATESYPFKHCSLRTHAFGLSTL